MKLMVFQAGHLKEARHRIAQQHHLRASDLEHPERASDRALEGLLNKLRAAHDIPSLAKQLTSMEQRLCPALLTHEETVIRYKSLICCEHMSMEFSPGVIWRAFCQYPQLGEFTPRLVTMMKRLIKQPSRHDFSPVQLHMLNAYKDKLNPLCQVFWDAYLSSASHALDAGKQELARIPESSMLSKILSYHALLYGRDAVWLKAPSDSILPYFKLMTLGDRVRTLIHGHKLLARADLIELTEHEIIMGMAEILRPHDELARELMSQSLQAYTWWKQILLATELTSFFRDYADNERAIFWSRYLPHFVDIKTDHKEMRLFMNFGGFGVIEFGEVGNAYYVYEKIDFIRLRDANFSTSRSLPHSSFKDRTLCIAWSAHGKRWKPRTDKKMSRWLSSYNN